MKKTISAKDMTKSFRLRVQALRANHDDFERAHAIEDQIRDDILKAIATKKLTGDDAWTAARIALSTANIDFLRVSA